jgi:hypothetical protein
LEREELLRDSEGTLSRWFRLHLQSLAPTNPHWTRVVGFIPFSLCVIDKEGLSLSSGDINGLMMMTMMMMKQKKLHRSNLVINKPIIKVFEKKM